MFLFGSFFTILRLFSLYWGCHYEHILSRYLFGSFFTILRCFCFIGIVFMVRSLESDVYALGVFIGTNGCLFLIV